MNNVGLTELGPKMLELSKLLRSGEKVAPTGTLYHVEDFNNFERDGFSSSDNIKRTKVVYIYTNPQFNRMFALLQDGRKLDYNLSFMDMFWNTFEVYSEPLPELTHAELEQKLGYQFKLKEEE